MEKGDQVKDCLDTGEMNIWTTAGIEKIALDRNDRSYYFVTCFFQPSELLRGQ